MIAAASIQIGGTSSAFAKLCNPAKEACWLSKGRGGSSSPAYPSSNSSIQINPAAVPVEETFGLETVVYSEEWDLALVRGLGRVGAAISPSNNEESFFGPPGFESSENFLQRKIDREKYESQKITGAAAFNIVSNKKTGMKQFRINFGVMGKYNRVSGQVLPGAGLSGIAGPLTFGYSHSKDQYVLEAEKYGLLENLDYRYSLDTFSLGLFLKSLALDYSILKINMDRDELGGADADVRILTASLLLKRWILTAAERREDSLRPEYNSETKTLSVSTVKKSLFGGVQFGVTKTILIGVFYNYYQLEETSLGLTFYL